MQWSTTSLGRAAKAIAMCTHLAHVSEKMKYLLVLKNFWKSRTRKKEVFV
jgi:hypothetical protein